VVRDLNLGPYKIFVSRLTISVFQLTPHLAIAATKIYWWSLQSATLEANGPLSSLSFDAVAILQDGLP
jgi:hypothetical protein